MPSRPALIVDVATAEDVAATIRWAAEHGSRVAVRATGHGAADPLDGVVLIRTGRLDAVTVEDGRARVGAGASWRRVADAALPLGLAPLAGSSSSVGVVGFLTGGGTGPLSRTCGIGADRVAALEVVTADGRSRRVTAASTGVDGELFWALRGAKGAAGVVTAVELDLLPLSTVLAGALVFDGADAPAVLHAWRSWCADLPAQATTSVALMRLPARPGIPAPLAGRFAVSVRFAWIGDVAAGERALAPMRAIAPVVFGGVGPMPAAAVGAIHGDPDAPTRGRERTASLTALPAAAVDALLAVAGPDSDCRQLVVEVRQLGGAVAAAPAVPSAFCGRTAAFTVLAVGVPIGDPEALDADAAAVVGALDPWATGGRLPNFGASTDPAEVARCFDAATLQRLDALLATVDPAGVLLDAGPVRAAAALAG